MAKVSWTLEVQRWLEDIFECNSTVVAGPEGTAAVKECLTRLASDSGLEAIFD